MNREIGPDAVLALLAALVRSVSADPPPDLREAIHDADLAIAQASARVRLLETDLRDAAEAEAEWRDRASEAADRSAARHAEGASPEAERLDELWRVALRRQQGYRTAVDAARAAMADQRRLVHELRDGRSAVRDRWGPLPARAETGPARPRG